MSDLNPLALYAYHLGTTPMQWAEEHVRDMINIHQDVIASRAANPGAWPGYCIEMTQEALARRILGELLDAGWTCPDATELLKGYEPPHLPPGKEAELKAACAYLNSLPDFGEAAQKRAAAELGQYAPIMDILFRAVEIAREEES